MILASSVCFGSSLPRDCPQACELDGVWLGSHDTVRGRRGDLGGDQSRPDRGGRRLTEPSLDMDWSSVLLGYCYIHTRVSQLP